VTDLAHYELEASEQNFTDPVPDYYRKPPSCPPYIKMPGSDILFIRMENLVLQQASSPPFGAYQVEESCIISVTRNTYVSFDTEKFEDSEKDFISRVAKLLKKSDYLSVVSIKISQKISNEFKGMLTRSILMPAPST
jgi:polyphosphate kinase